MSFETDHVEQCENNSIGPDSAKDTEAVSELSTFIFEEYDEEVVDDHDIGVYSEPVNDVFIVDCSDDCSSMYCATASEQTPYQPMEEAILVSFIKNSCKFLPAWYSKYKWILTTKKYFVSTADMLKNII